MPLLSFCEGSETSPRSRAASAANDSRAAHGISHLPRYTMFSESVVRTVKKGGGAGRGREGGCERVAPTKLDE